METARRAVIYARISETDKDRDKVADQIAQCKRLADRRGYEVVDVFKDDGITGLGHKERPGYRLLLEAADRREFDVILATEEERLARNVPEKADLQATCIDAGIVWETERDGYVDPATEAGEFFSTMRAAMGRMESRRKASRQRAANQEKSSEGKPLPGRRRYGYEVDGRTPRADEAAVVRRMFDHVAAGESLRSLWLAFRAEGVDPGPGKGEWRIGRIRDILKNPHYAGYVTHHGVTTKSDVIVPIVDDALAEDVRNILADPTRRTTPGGQPRHLVSNIAFCGYVGVDEDGHDVACQSRMVHMHGYRCAAESSHTHIKKDWLEARVVDEVARALITGGPSIFPSSSGASIAALLADHRRNAAEVAETLADRADGTIGPDDARAHLRILRARREAIEADLERLRSDRTAAAALADVAVDLIGDQEEWTLAEYDGIRDKVGERFLALDIDQQREIVRALVVVTVNPGRDPRRVVVDHLLATSLNADSEFIEFGEGNSPRGPETDPAKRRLPRAVRTA